jgi:TolB-like protein/Tfp pilus assembly protein PilF
MFTDVIGYTALGQRNEELSIAMIDEQRRVLRPIFNRHKGREVKTMGDGSLVEFRSALEAVRCAYDIQRAIRERNIPLPASNRIHLRVGVHLGEVLDSDGDISGDAVNVASRIEGLAEDGGVCVTRQVYDHVQNKLELAFANLGLRPVKNVSSPVEVYKMVMPWESQTFRPEETLDKRRIAVLPFANMSPDSRDDYFVDGMTEELIATMSKISSLKVIARTSVMGYKGTQKKVNEIARDLGVGTILEGSVRKAGEKLRITVQLVDARTSAHLWSESYNRELKDIFAIQTDISKTVAEALKVQFLSQEQSQIEARQTGDPLAYVLYLKGRSHWNTRSEEGVNRAIKLFEEAVARDPEYALAYVGLADCYSILGLYGYRRPSAVFPLAKELATKALGLDDNLAEAHASISEPMTHYYYDWTRADFELRRALELNPNFSQAHSWFGVCYLASMGRLDEALTELRKAEQLDPLSPRIVSEVGRVLYFARRYDEAILQYEKAFRLEPDSAILHKWLADVYSQKSMFDKALTEIEKAVQLSKGSVFILDDAGYVYAASGRREEAQKVLDQLDELSGEMYVPEYGRAAIYVGLGDKDKAMEWLWKAYKERCFLTWLKVEPVFDLLRDDSRFNSLLEKLGLA